jgi:hypothetical protein
MVRARVIRTVITPIMVRARVIRTVITPIMVRARVIRTVITPNAYTMTQGFLTIVMVMINMVYLMLATEALRIG